MSKSNIKKIKSSDGIVRYVKDGKLHNSEGPALIKPDGTEEYYVNGFKYSKDDFKRLKKSGEGLPWFKQSGVNARY